MLDAEPRAREVCALSRILILGGYGGFGARLTRRLLVRGHSVLVAGRSLEKARAFCADAERAEPVVANRNGDLAPLLAETAPDLVIDAAGPFQGSDYRVPLSCACAKIPYLDLADARAFVTGISTLNVEASDAGVAFVAGASSVPALSGAVARELATGLDKVFAVEMAISASKRATAGASVVTAILSYVGKPIRLWRGRRWDGGFGWQELVCETFALRNGGQLARRWLALADVPDLDLMPEILPGRPAVIFRAGTESALQTVGLWLLSWPARWFGLRGMTRLMPLLLFLQRLTQSPSSDRSGMYVRLKGETGGTLVERQWALIASDDDGPEIPTLAAAILADAILAGKIAPGAQPAHALLTLAQFEPLFATLSLRHEIVERRLPPPLYAQVMGDRFALLPGMVRRLHRVCGDSGAAGVAVVTGGETIVARLIAGIMGFPKAGSYPLHVSFAEHNGIERWTRRFGDQTFTSDLSERNGRLVERFGALRFTFDLLSDARGLEMRLRRWSLLGIPLPLALAPRGVAREWEELGRFHFDVPISLPLVGRIVHYTGWLEPS
jgi:NAD(P)-dependent dehydrogenase (short-subunit alcohol dehydrogenase family)